MSRHTIEELIARWKGEHMTTEQMIGQILLTLHDLEQRQRASERREAASPAAPPSPPTAPPPAAEQRRTRRR